MNNQPNIQAVVKQPARTEIEFMPFGGDTKIKLSVQIVHKFLCKPTKSGQLPTEADAMKFMMLCQARALNPFEGDAWLVGYDAQGGPEFSMITGIQAFYKRAEVNPDHDGIESGIIVRREDGTVEDIEGEWHDDGDEVVGGWAKVYNKTKKHPTKSRIRLSAFRKDNKFWKGDTAGMIAKCAEADALRRAYPTKLGGLYLPGEHRTEDERFAHAKTVTGPLLAAQEEREAKQIDVVSEAPAAGETKPSQQEELANLVESNGFDWPTFKVWADASGNIPDGVTWNSWSDVSDADAKRFNRSKAGLLKGLTEIKAVGK